jgi:lipopolysaccharide biosynthesis glycosyltransferase
MGVTLYSALSNLERGRSVSLYIMDGGISGRNRQKLVDVLSATDIDAQITWLKPDLMQFEGLPLTEWVAAPATYLRLLIPELLPRECDRALYLDSDLVVEHDIGQLWEHDLRDVRAAGVPNYFSPIVAWKRHPSEMTSVFGLTPQATFCNAGVLLFNLHRWREEQLGRKALEFARDFPLPESDQDAINIVVASQWAVLDARWNVQLSALERYGSFLKASLTLSDREMEQACADLLGNPYILHFTWMNKPWQIDCQVPLRVRFFHYLKKSRWFSDIEDDNELMEVTFSEQAASEPWVKKVKAAKQDLDSVIPRGESLILVDQATWHARAVAGWRTVPFLERDGAFCGLPLDDKTAIQEFERLRKTDVHFMVFVWATFWWFGQYPQLIAHLQDHFVCVLKNERVVVFDLRSHPHDSPLK